MKKNKKRILCSIAVLLLCASFIGSTAVSAKVKISPKKITLVKGKTAKLKLTGTKKKAKWVSSNRKVATVNARGAVKAKKAGKAVIKAKVGKKTYKCTVYVKKLQSTVPDGADVQDSDGEDGWGPIIPFE